MFSKKHRVLAVLIIVLVLGIGGLGYSLVRTGEIKTKADTIVYPKIELSPVSGTYQVGQTFDVTVTVDTANCTQTGGAYAGIKYPSNLQAISVTPGTIYDKINTTILPDKRIISISSNTTKDFLGYGVLGTIKFKALLAGSAIVGFSQSNGYNTGLLCVPNVGVSSNYATYNIVGTTASNLVPNPSFETSTSYPQKADKWTVANSFNRVAENPKDGSYSFRYSGLYTSVAENNFISVKPSTTYTLSGWVYLNAGYKGVAYLDLGDIAEECQVIANSTAIGSWQNISCTFKTSATRTLVKVRLVNSPTAQSTAYWDLISLKAAQ